MTSKLIFKAGDDWTDEILANVWEAIEEVAKDLKISYYKPQIEIVSARQMLDAYTSVGMPIYYKHWSFGKEFVQSEKQYKAGKMGLAYELVINSNPCIAYLMEENSALMQCLVLAHASVGHSAVFKNNYLFAEHTDASSIVDYLSFAKGYVKKCEEKYGEHEVEMVLDACHALQSYGVDKYKKPRKISAHQEQQKAFERFEQELNEYDALWEKVGKPQAARNKKLAKTLVKVPAIKPLDEPQENILYFIEKNAPHLAAWKREIIRIVRKLAEYFMPQRATQVVNEGYATFCHFYILNEMYNRGYLDDGSMFELFHSHSGVLRQPDLGNFNPYTLGFKIFMDIKRMCEAPTEEDYKYFPNLAGKNWVEEINYAMINFKNETFIQQYLSPRVARDLNLFAINDAGLMAEEYKVLAISNEKGFQLLREKLAASYAVENIQPDVQITAVDYKGTRKLMLEHFVKKGKPLGRHDAEMVCQYIAELWEYSAQLKTIEYDEKGEPVPLTFTAVGRYSGKKLDD